MTTFTSTMALRPAEPADALRLFTWRTDPETQAMSLHPGPQTLDEHRGWLDRVLADPQVNLFIAELDGAPVGTGRLNWQGARRQLAEVSVTVAPEARQRGHAAELIQL